MEQKEVLKDIKKEILEIFADELGETAMKSLEVNDGTGAITVEESQNNGELLMGTRLYKRVVALFESKGV